MEWARCLLFDFILNEKYLVEVAAYIVNTLNRCPHTCLDYLTFEEKLFKHLHNLDNLRVFDCVGYIHQSQGKLKPRVVKCMFVAFTDGVKGFKMWHPIEKMFIGSRDVAFKKDERCLSRKRIWQWKFLMVEVNLNESPIETSPQVKTKQNEAKTTREHVENVEAQPNFSQY